MGRSLEPDYNATIRAGRAHVRLIEAVAVLIEWEEDERSRRTCQQLRRSAHKRLPKLVEALLPHVTARYWLRSRRQ